jgi:GTPase
LLPPSFRAARDGNAHIHWHAVPTRAIVLVPQLARSAKTATAAVTQAGGPAIASLAHSPADRLREALGLAGAIDLDIRASAIVPVSRPRAATLFGSGKVAEVGALAKRHEVGLIVIDHAITPVQQRNLEKAWQSKVIDRTGLILEIFGRRARTREGCLQVDLAHLTYQKSRLVRSWTHLERQRGGAGFLGGPGESQLELDRRLIEARIDALKAELADVIRTRELHRVGRRRVPYKTVAIVGYTNAGKSTLFNCLSGASVRVKDQLFATLDPTMREVRLANGRRIIVSDTVGFIADLPTLLVAAFRATLEEVVEADVVLHVRDISHPESAAQARDVESVLADLGVDVPNPQAHVVEVWNKIDRIDEDERCELWRRARLAPRAPVLVSALTGEGIDKLKATIDQFLGTRDEIIALQVPAKEGRLLSWLHANAEVLSRETSATGAVACQLRIDPAGKARLLAVLREAGLSLGDKA